MAAPAYPKGDLRRMLAVLAVIQEARGATILQVVTRTGLDKKTVSDLITKTQQQAGVQVSKAGPKYTISDLGPVFKVSEGKLALKGALNPPIIGSS